MTQHLTVEVSESVSLDLSAYEHLDPAAAERERFNPHRFEYAFTLADTVDRSAVATDIEAQLPTVTWATATWRWTPAEYDEAQYRDDATYSLADHDLVTPVTFAVDGWGLTVTYADETWTETYSEPAGYSETHEVTRNGTVLGSVTTKQPIDGLPESGLDSRAYPPAAPAPETLLTVGTKPESEPIDSRLHRVEQGIGSASGEGKRGIAKRIDDLEDAVFNS